MDDDECLTLEDLRNRLKEQCIEAGRLKDLNCYLLNQLQFQTLQSANCSCFLGAMLKKLIPLCESLPTDRAGCREVISQCICHLKLFINQNVWREYRLRFAETHTGFYDRLIANYPTLTECDLRLCALIKLSMSTKEIASLLNQPVNSVKVARRRLREKLQNEQTSSLICILARY